MFTILHTLTHTSDLSRHAGNVKVASDVISLGVSVKVDAVPSAFIFVKSVLHEVLAVNDSRYVASILSVNISLQCLCRNTDT